MKSATTSDPILHLDTMILFCKRDLTERFTEREVLPRIALGPDAFYATDGRILPAFRVHMDLQKEFAADLRKLSNQAHDLRLRLETVRSSK